jgi:xylulokinase
MESVAALLKDNLDALERFGVEIHELRALGGASKSPLWLQIKADLLNKTVTTLACDEATSLGAAMLGAIAAGDFADAAAAQAAMVHAASSVTPGENVAAYEPYFAKYKEINNLLLNTF